MLGLSQRIQPFLSTPLHTKCIIEIGTNDILLPFLLTCSSRWEKNIRLLTRRGSVPCTDGEQFQEVYQRLMHELIEHGKNARVISIPCVGEDLCSDLNARVDAYNAVIRTLCGQYSIPYIDFNGWQKSVIETGSPYFLSHDPLDVAIDALLTTYLPFGGLISRKRGLAVTVDGVHLNRTGARGLAALIDTEGKGL